jgi:hypothetical protein
MKFDISSTSEMTLEYRAAKEADVNPEYLREKQISLIAKEFANNPDLKKRLILQLELDPLPGLTVQDSDTLIANGTISKHDAVLHFQMGKLVNQAILEKTGFLNFEKGEKIKILNDYADKFIAENKVKLDTTAIEQNGKAKNPVLQ